MRLAHCQHQFQLIIHPESYDMSKNLADRLSTIVSLTTFAGLLFFPVSSQAINISGILKMGYDFGGDKMVSATLVTGSGTSNEAIYANSGLVLAGGVSFMNDEKNFSVDTTIGWKSDNIEASNQDFEFSRYPLDVLAFYNLPLGKTGNMRMRFGAGVTSHINPKFSASGSLANGSVKFDNALGFVAQIDAVTGDGRSGVNFGLRYTSLDYEANGVPPIKANGVGLFVGAMF